MKGVFRHCWTLGVACVLAGAILASSDSFSQEATPAAAPPRSPSAVPEARSFPTQSATPAEALPPPAPAGSSHPLRLDALFTTGYDIPWLNSQNAWVSSDGKSVAFFTGEPPWAETIARTLLVKDVDTDTITFEKKLFSPEESAQRSSPDLERLARKQAWEALPSMERHQWKRMVHQELPPHENEFFSDACFEKQLRPKRAVSVDDLKISYQEPRVQISHRGKKVLDRRVPAWKLRQEGCAKASPSWLQEVFVSHEHGVVLLKLGFCGMDRCPEPAATFHVLRIPSKKPPADGPSSSQGAAAVRTPAVGYERAGAARETLYVTGLPAVSEDGQLVAFAERLVEDERQGPNLLLTVHRPQTQELVWRFPVLEAGEVLERIRQANDSLGKTRWVPLEERPIHPMVTESCQQAPAQKLQLPELELTFNQGHLVLKQGDTAPVEMTLARDGPQRKDACSAASRTFIDAAYVALAKGVVLLRLTTCGDESCPAREPRYHAIKLR